MKRVTISGYRFVFIVSLLSAATLLGQLRSDVQQIPPAQSLKSVANASWLDPQRFSMHHGVSLSFMSGSGLGGGPNSLSVYTNQMRYLVTENIVLNSQIHLVQSGIMGTPELGGNNLKMYYQTALDWQLSKNVRMHFGISNLPYMGYGSGWGRRQYSPYLGSQRWGASPAMD